MLRKLKKEVKLEKEKINDHMASWKIQLLRWNQQNMRDEQNGSPVNVVGVFLVALHYPVYLLWQYHSDFHRGNTSSSTACDLVGLSVQGCCTALLQKKGRPIAQAVLIGLFTLAL